MKTKKLSLIFLSTLLLPASGFCSMSWQGYYVAGKLGVFQGGFNQKYIDITDTTAQNFEENLQQNGYLTGVAFGYQQKYLQNYSLGGEFSANLDSHHATFQSGSASSSFSDNLQLQYHFDLVFVPEMYLSDTIASYLKLGISYAGLSDNLWSPVGTAATMTKYSSSKNRLGAALGIGITKQVSKSYSIFAEANYHDYGVIDWRNFVNFSSDYTHSTRVTSSSVEVGLAYHFV